MFNRLPTNEQSPGRSAGLWLAAAALVLIPADLALEHYGDTHRDRVPAKTTVDMTVVDGVERPVLMGHHVLFQPLWVIGVRAALPMAALAMLVAFRRIRRQDAGLTLGNPRVTLFWLAAPLAVGAVIGLLALGVGILLVRGFGLPLPGWVGVPLTSVRSFWGPEHVWRVVCQSCVLAPLVEDTPYRGILAPALERLGGKGLAVVGSGLAWAGLHAFYGYPLSSAPGYFAWGMCGGWVFLKSRSLLPVYVHHSLGNGVQFGHDVLVLQFPGLIPALFGGRPPGGP